MTKKTRRAKARRALLALSLVLVTMMVTVGGTIAWLTADTDPVVNTFTPSNINITLNETEGTLNADGEREFRMVPGATIEKDPVVTVEGGSEKLWLFVEVEKKNNFDNYMTYSIAAGWTELTTGSGIYYQTVEASDADQSFDIIANDTVTVLGTVNKDMMDALENGTVQQPTLTFTAYAIQFASFDTADEAWAEISSPTTGA